MRLPQMPLYDVCQPVDVVVEPQRYRLDVLDFLVSCVDVLRRLHDAP